jgi:hypothetical protein
MTTQDTDDEQSNPKKPKKKLTPDERGEASLRRELDKRYLSVKGRELRRRAEAGETFDTPEAEQELREAGFHKVREDDKVYIVPTAWELGPARMFDTLRLVDPGTGQLAFEIDLLMPNSVIIHDCRSGARELLASGLRLAGLDRIPQMGPVFLDLAAHEQDALAQLGVLFRLKQEIAVKYGFIEQPAAPERYTRDPKLAAILRKALEYEAATGRPASVADLARELEMPRTTVSELLPKAKDIFYATEERRQEELAKLIAEQRADDRNTIARDVVSPEEGLIERRIARNSLAAGALFDTPAEDDPA